MQVHQVSVSEKYLGMPSDVGRAKSGAFKYLKDRLWNRVQGWMEQTLSAGGKEVLIKAVAQAVPTYSMSCFKLPRGLCLHLESLMRKFWWGSKAGARKPAWVSWEIMTRAKFDGGLGFRDGAIQLGPSGSPSLAHLAGAGDAEREDIEGCLFPGWGVSRRSSWQASLAGLAFHC